MNILNHCPQNTLYEKLVSVPAPHVVFPTFSKFSGVSSLFKRALEQTDYRPTGCGAQPYLSQK